MIDKTAQILKALGEPTRLRIVRLLKERELCICELVVVMDMSQPRISQHVKILKQAGIVRERKEKQRCFFSLDDRLKVGKLISMENLMNTNIEIISELQAEGTRLQNIDHNQQVIECRNQLEPVSI